ncbi:MAG: cytosine/creatinine deaminase, partial [Hyphomicrobiales bacterium]|nr:cytosine/creatinine deaminase [Hyphomicrobiales bacterium]
MFSISIPPNASAYRLTNARVPVCLVADAAQLKPDADGLAPCDIVIDNGRIAAIGPVGGAKDDLASVDLDRGMVLPRLVDIHTHIDKGHIWPRAQNPNGTHLGARTAVMADRQANWSAEDVRRRMDFALRCAFAHGTGALRTHIDSYPGQTAITWPLFAEMRE